MNSINKLGLTAVVTTALVLSAVFGAWWGIKNYWLKPTTETLQQAQGKQATSTQEPQFASLPSPETLPAGPWTKKYLASLPADTPQGQILNNERLTAFVNANKGQLLPTLPAGLIKISAASGPEATKKYVEQISPATNQRLQAVTTAEIESAWRLAYQNNQPETINDLIQKLLENVKALEAIEAPAGQTALHTKIVAAAHALTNNTELLRDMKSDWVGGLIGAKNIDELGTVFKDIEAEIGRLKE